MTLETLARQEMKSHAALNARLTKTPCDLDIDTEWPYECVAKDDSPSDVVVVCRQHLVWSHFKRPETSS